MVAPQASPDPHQSARLRRFGEIDWDFPAQASESAFSALHWHPCRFPSQIPALAIGRFTRPGECILDPFMGSATTLVEAQRLGRKSVGIDINPVACLLAEAKTLPLSARDIRSIINRLKLLVCSRWDEIPLEPPPTTVQADKWYMPETLLALCKIWTLIGQQDETSALVGRACFSAILLAACREDRHWGYVCDNTAPKSLREPDGRALFVTSLDRMSSAYNGRDISELIIPSAKIIHGDAQTVLAEMPPDQFDGVVTSPPYFGVADYVKSQRLSMEWLSEKIEPFRLREIGARSKRHRSSALTAYLEELKTTFFEVHRVMKDSATALIVFGQSPKRQDVQPMFIDHLLGIGFSLELCKVRQIAVGRRQKPSIVTETVLVLRKTP